METFITYLLKVNVALTVFYVLYALFLKNDTFIRLRRCYFLSVVAFSFLYPRVTVAALGNAFSLRPSGVSETAATVTVGELGVVGVDGGVAGAASVSVPWMQIFYLLFTLVTAAFAMRFLWQLTSILRIRAKSEKRHIGNAVVYHLAGGATPFSFFSWIFINTETHSDAEMAQILLHEQTHARQWHSADIVMMELLCILFWYNPAAWLMKRETAINLEYLADNSVLRHGINSREYQYHLLKLTYQKTAVQIVNNFNVSPLKKRIMMMNQTKSPLYRLTKYLLIIPLVLLLVAVNSCTNKEKKAETDNVEASQIVDEVTDKIMNDTSEVFVVVEQNPEFPGGLNAMMKYLNDSIKYPLIAQENGIQGRVVTNFVVEKDGSITDVQVVRSIDPSLDGEAVRVIKSMPNWTPGTQRGEHVRVRYTLPVTFRLQGKESGTISEKVYADDKKKNELKNTDEVFVVVEKIPEFPGGSDAMMKYLSDNIKYPAEAISKGTQGRVVANFVVEKDGSITDVQVVRSIDPLLDAEALRVIKSMPNWTPGMQRGQPVRVRYTVPVVFSLRN